MEDCAQSLADMKESCRSKVEEMKGNEYSASNIKECEDCNVHPKVEKGVVVMGVRNKKRVRFRSAFMNSINLHESCC